MQAKFDSFNRFETPAMTLCRPGAEYNNGNITNTLGFLTFTSDEEIVANFNELSELNFVIHKVDSGSDPDGLYDGTKNHQYVYVEDIGFFCIDSVEEVIDSGESYKDVSAKSCEVELENKVMPTSFYSKESEIEYGSNFTFEFQELLELLVGSAPLWTIGTIASSLLGVHRTFEDVSEDTNILSFMLENMQDAFECIFVFDIINREINVYDQNDYVNHTSIYLSNDDIVQSIKITSNSDDIYTALFVAGENEQSIGAVNPLGGGTIYKFDYYLNVMTSTLAQKVADWEALVASYESDYYNYAITKYDLLQSRSTKKSEIETYKQNRDMYQRCAENIIASAGIDDLTIDYITADGSTGKSISDMVGSYNDGISDENDNVIIYLFKYSNTAPSVSWTTDIAYDFDTKKLTGVPYGWNRYPRAIRSNSGNYKNYMIAATASKATNGGVIKYTEWTTPVVEYKPVSTLTYANMVKTIFLYQRSASQPSVPNESITYNYLQGTFTGDTSSTRYDLNSGINNWSTQLPEKNSNTCWVISATLLAIPNLGIIFLEPYSVPKTEWSDVSLYQAGVLEIQVNPSFAEQLVINSNQATTTYETSSSVDGKIQNLFIKDDDGIYTQKLTQTSSVIPATNTFNYDPSTKKLTFHSGQFADGTKIAVFYHTDETSAEENAVVISDLLVQIKDEYDADTDRIEAAESELAQIESDLAYVNAEIQDILDDVNMETYFTSDELNELQLYIFEGQYSDEYLTITDQMTMPEQLDQIKQMYDRAKNQLDKVSCPSEEFSVDVENFVFQKKFNHMTSELETGSLIAVEIHPNDVADLFLSNFTVNYEDNTMSMTFGNRYNKYDSKSLFEDVLGNIQKSANTLNYVKDALYPIKSDFDSMQHTLSEIRMLSASQAFTSKNQNIIIDNTGITGRQIKNGDEYYPEQLKIVNNMIAMTDDNWESCKIALGKLLIDDDYYYGLNTQVLMGDIILGSHLKIKNDSGNLSFDDDGFEITNGKNTFTVNPNNNSKLLAITKSGTPNTDLLYLDSNGNMHISGSVTIGSSGSQMEDIVAGVESVTKFCIHTSSSTPPSSSATWSTSSAGWTPNHYVWTRTDITTTYVDGSTYTTNTTPVYDEALTLALSTASSADSKLETWAQQTDPASSWTTQAMKDLHNGDLWYYTGTTTLTVNTVTISPSKTYQYNATTGKWVLYESSNKSLFDFADGKSTIYYGSLYKGTAYNSGVHYIDETAYSSYSNGDFFYNTSSGVTSIRVNSSWTTFDSAYGAESGDYLVDAYDGATYRWSGSLWVKVTDYKSQIPTNVTDLIGGTDILYTTDVTVSNQTTANGLTKRTITIGSKQFTEIEAGDFVFTDIGLGTDQAGSKYFMIANDGLLKARNALIYGTIYASAGEIGGWSIGSGQNQLDGSLKYGTFGSANSIWLIPKGITSSTTIGSRAGTDWVLTAGANFGVTKTGAVYANDIHLTGTITLGSGETVDLNKIYSPNLLKFGYWDETFVNATFPFRNWKKESNASISYSSSTDLVTITCSDSYYGLRQSVAVKPNTKYTLSAQVGNSFHLGFGSGEYPTDVGTGWTTADDGRVYKTFTTSSSATTYTVYAYANTAASATDCIINRIKLEEGDTYTGWANDSESAVGASSTAVDAAKTATNYLVAYSNGMKIYDGSHGGNYIWLDANGLDIYNGNNKIATYGSTIHLGDASTNYAEIGSSGMSITQGGYQVASFGSNVTIGNTANTNLYITSSALQMRRNGVVMAQFAYETSGNTSGLYISALNRSAQFYSSKTTINNNDTYTTGISSSGYSDTISLVSHDSTNYHTSISMQPRTATLEAWARGSGTSYVNVATSGDYAMELHSYGSINIECGNNLYLQSEAGRISFFTNQSSANVFRPDVDESIVLGTTTYRWKSVFCHDICCTDNAFASCDIKLKDNIEQMSFAHDLIMSLKPVSFMWKNGDHRRKRMGFIAQDVAKTCNELNENLMCVTASYKSSDDEPTKEYFGEEVDDDLLTWSISYPEFIAPMVAVIQQLDAKVNELENKLNELKES